MKNAVESLNSLITIILIGSLMLLSFLLISDFLKVNKKANIFFGSFLLVWTSFWTEEILQLINLNISNWFSSIINCLQAFVAILFYFGVLYFTNPYRKYKQIDAFHFVIPILVVFVYLSNIKFNNVLGWNHVFSYLLLLQALFYTVSSLLLLRKHQKRIEFFNSIREAVDLKWIKYIILSLIIISVFFYWI